jgi:hypothetical protein
LPWNENWRFPSRGFLLLERKGMKNFATILGRATLWAFCGAVVGWFAGLAYYFLISVPKAEGMHPMYRESFLCAEGQAPLAFALLGIIVGIIFGSRMGKGIPVSQRGDERAKQTNSMWLR